jgi:hypothetical protein
MAELAPQELIASLRRPKTILTDAYLNDPIQFDPDDRFEPESVLRQLNEIPIVDRDSVEFVMADINKQHEQWYPITMFRIRYSRGDVARVVDKQFKELI